MVLTEKEKQDIDYALQRLPRMDPADEENLLETSKVFEEWLEQGTMMNGKFRVCDYLVQLTDEGFVMSVVILNVYFLYV